MCNVSIVLGKTNYIVIIKILKKEQKNQQLLLNELIMGIPRSQNKFVEECLSKQQVVKI